MGQGLKQEDCDPNLGRDGTFLSTSQLVIAAERPSRAERESPFCLTFGALSA